MQEIIREVLESQHGFSEDFLELRIFNAGKTPREVCVQYAESDLHFISRICEEEGIYYFFEHSGSAHKQVFSDLPGGQPVTPARPLRFFPGSGQAAESTVITRLRLRQNTGACVASYRDWNFSRPGAWALKELRLLCRMAKHPPSVGQWNMFYARLIRLISLYREQQDEAGLFVRRIEREMDCLWLFLQENGVAPTNNHAERALRFAVLWRKRSFGTRAEKGDRFVERILSLRQTCHLQGKRTFRILIEAMEAFMQGRPPDLSWIYQNTKHATP